jgi:glutamate racemase
VALGCTHYTFLLPEFAALRRDLRWFDPAGAVARQAVRVVGRAGGGGGFFVTGAVRDAAMMARRIEGYGFSAIERLGVPAA